MNWMSKPIEVDTVDIVVACNFFDQFNRPFANVVTIEVDARPPAMLGTGRMRRPIISLAKKRIGVVGLPLRP